MRRPPLSVIVLTKNEEDLVARCLFGLAWAEEVLVVDSGSSDDTTRIASDLGARVEHVEWHGWASQRVRATELASHDWVFFVDADEFVTPELSAEISTHLQQNPDATVSFSMKRSNEFMGVLLPNSDRRSIGLVRLFNRTKSSYDVSELVHERVKTSGEVVRLQAPLLHWRTQSVRQQVERLNFYSTVEAEALSPAMSRGALRARLFLMPMLRLGWHLIFKNEWRLGTRGVTHAGLRATADFLRYAKAIERTLPNYAEHPPGYTPNSTRASDDALDSDALS